jgi:nuclear pore complex protein Nup93
MAFNASSFFPKSNAPATGSTPAANLGGTGMGAQPSSQGQPASGGSIFNTPNTTAPGSSIFGNPAPTAQAQPTGGMFANLNKPQNPSPLGGGLNMGATSGGLGGSVFGGLTAATTTAAPLGSMFATSTANTNQQQQQPALGTSIFGAPQPSSLGLNQSQAQPQQTQNQAPAGGAYFDSLLAKSKKQAEGESVMEDLPSLQLGLGDLRQRLRKLGPGSKDRHIDGRAHYLLAGSGVDPGAAARDLGAAFGVHGRSDRPIPGTATAELDVETYLSNLQTKTTLSMIADGLERSVRDFDTFVEDNVTMEWEAQRKRIYQHFGIKPREETAHAPGSTQNRETQGGFGRSARRKSTAPTQGGKSTQKASTFGRSSIHNKSLIGAPSRIGSHAPDFADVESGLDGTGSHHGAATMDDRFSREKQAKLADIVHGLNDARQYGQQMSLLGELAEVEERSGDRHAPHMVDAYRAMMEIIEEDPDHGRIPRQRQFAKMYLDPNPNTANAIAMRKRILKGANRYLEKQFYSEVESLIAKYPQDANLGGRPDVVSKIRAYIRLRMTRKSLVPDQYELQEQNGEPLWAVVFFLLRSGHVDEAAQYVNDNQVTFRTVDRTFSAYMNSYASSEDRRLKRQMQERCNNEYAQRVKNAPDKSIDPFRIACYKIVGRCEVNNRTLENLQTDVNDWVWLQFNLAREGDRSAELATEMYGLSELQASIREIGLKHFPKNTSEDTNGNFGMFFYLQILSGMFEQAIAYLYPFSYVDAVHFAIALEYYGLLRPADPLTAGNDLLSHNTRGQPQINFGRMVGYYTRDFRAADVGAAVDYLILLCLNSDEVGAGSQHVALCHEALRELVLETREFSKLIGDIKPDGHRIKGLIEERGPLVAPVGEEAEFVKTITLQAASFADDNGRTTDAVLLYHLAGDYDTVVAIVSRALSEAISLEIGEDPMRLIPVKPRVAGKDTQAGSSLSLAAIDDPVELAKTMMTMYEQDRAFWQSIRDQNRVACSVLLQMSEIKGLVEAGMWPQCLDVSSPLDFYLQLK